MRKISHTVRKSIFLVQDVGYPTKQVHCQIGGPLFCVCVQVFGILKRKLLRFGLLSKVSINRRYRLLEDDTECLY